jgi:uncharacterized membrane protein YfcA
MYVEELLKLILLALVAALLWSFWSANIGRRAARVGRRWVRRVTFTVLVLLVAGFMLV